MTAQRDRLHPEVTRAAMRHLDKEDDDEEATARRRRQRKKTPATDSCGGICVVTVLLALVCWCVSPVLAGGNSDTGVATSPFANTTSLYSSLKLGSRLVRRRDRHPDQEHLAVNETEDEVTTPLPGCQSCIFREGLRNLSLQTIKEEILSKLGMKHASNTTGRQLPKIPPLHHLLQIYEQQQGVPGMQGDEPVRASGSFKPGSVVQEEEDDYHARTERVIAFAQPCEYTATFLGVWGACRLGETRNSCRISGAPSFGGSAAI